jgi:hypothetical protein
MSLKQISFSPELLDAPEVKDIEMDKSCLSADMDLSQVNFADGTPGHNLFNTNLSPQLGGGIPKESNDNNEYKYNEHYEHNDTNSESEQKDYISSPNVDDELQKVNFWEQSGGTDLENLESEVTLAEITNNPDNPGEDPQQADDAIDENDRDYEEDGHSVESRLNEIRKMQMEMDSVENREEIKELENLKMKELNFDLTSLSKKLEHAMDLYWDKNLDMVYVESKVDQYIKNYNSKDYETYRKMLIYVLTKTKAGYKLTIGNKGEYILHKGNESNYDIKLTPPKYIDLSIDTRRLKKEIKETLFKLYDTKSELIDNADKLLEEDLKEFRQLQKKYYDLIHTEAIYDSYHKKINDRKDDEIELFLNFIRKKNNFKNDAVHSIETKYVKAPISFQENIRQSKISSLELFNQIQNKFEKHYAINEKMSKEDTKEMKGLIKKYLTTGNTTTILHMIEQFQTKHKKMVNIIIEKKPVIDVKSSGKRKSKSKKKSKPKKEKRK